MVKSKSRQNRKEIGKKVEGNGQKRGRGERRERPAKASLVFEWAGHAVLRAGQRW